MSKKRWQIVGVLAVVAVIAVGVVVAFDPFPGNRVFSNVYGEAGQLEIVGVSAGRLSPARFHGDGQAATVQLGGQTARVNAKRIELADGRSIAVPPTCKRVELRESNRGIVVQLDGVETR